MMSLDRRDSLDAILSRVPTSDDWALAIAAKIPREAFAEGSPISRDAALKYITPEEWIELMAGQARFHDEIISCLAVELECVIASAETTGRLT